MGRPRKYQHGSETICISLPKEVLEFVDTKAIKAGKNRSEFISFLLKGAAMQDSDYAKMMARHYNKKFYYWKSEMERLNKEKEEGI